MTASDAHRAFSVAFSSTSEMRSDIRCGRRAARRRRAREQREFEQRNPAIAEAYAEQREREEREAIEIVGTPAEARAMRGLPDPTDRQRRIVRTALAREEHPEWFGWRPNNDARERFHGAGYQHPGGVINDNVEQAPVSETGARSTNDPFLRRFIAAACVGGRVHAGFTKRSAHNARVKRVGLDMPVIRVCGSGARDIWRQDHDGLDLTPDEFDAAVAEVAEQYGVWPHCRVSYDDVRYPGRIRSAHLWFALREGAAVFGGETNIGAQKLLQAVQAALVVAFARLGADPGGLSDPYQGKNPVSPHSRYHRYDDAEWLTLADMRDRLREGGIDVVGMGAERAAREIAVAREVAGGAPLTPSNELFTWIADACCAAVSARHHAGQDWQDQASVEADVWSRRETCTVRSDRADWRLDNALRKMLPNCARVAIATFDPKKADRNHRRRGAIKHRLSDVDSHRDRQAEGGRYSAEKVASRNLHAIARAMATYVRSGTTPDVRVIAAETGLSERTVQRHMTAAWTAAAASHALEEARRRAVEFERATRDIASSLAATSGAVKGYPLYAVTPNSPSSAYAPSSVLLGFSSESTVPLQWRAAYRRSRLLNGRDHGLSRRNVVIGRAMLDYLSAGGIRAFVPAAA
ncbi:hypothetical protein [Rhodopseudomonas palustris]|uniref:hypothetical protein n=1 Tax=Rhodopseudomonas palustris TaxID=1076 RepID=UPI0021F289FF|nr:hypothetical protein [Rhodopseudomonas palustris]UYO55203.1 hypothetical protein KQX61_07310 [Rhodopseudomonas palustris]